MGDLHVAGVDWPPATRDWRARQPGVLTVRVSCDFFFFFFCLLLFLCVDRVLLLCRLRAVLFSQILSLSLEANFILYAICTLGGAIVLLQAYMLMASSKKATFVRAGGPLAHHLLA